MGGERERERVCLSVGLWPHQSKFTLVISGSKWLLSQGTCGERGGVGVWPTLGWMGRTAGQGQG